jgi:hypothetical protein
MKKALTTFFLIMLISKITFSQVDDRFSFLGASSIKEFGKPLVTSFGIAMNTGSFHSASISRTFGFSIGIKGMMIFVPDDQKTFTPNLPAGYKSVSDNDATATFFGDEGGIYVGPQGLITYPSGINESSIPMVFPQATFSFMGNELLLRFVTIPVKNENVTLFGVGFKHSISQYIPFSPLDIAVQVLYDNFTYGNTVKSTNLAFNAEASKTFGIFTAYGSLQYETSKLKFEYDIKQDVNSGDPEIVNGGKVSVEVEGDNKMRFTVGGALSLGVLVLNLDYSVGSQSVASTGLTFEF